MFGYTTGGQEAPERRRRTDPEAFPEITDGSHQRLTRTFSRSTAASLKSGSDTLAVMGCGQQYRHALRALPDRSPLILPKRERRHGLRCACKHTMIRYDRNPPERTATPQIPNTCCPAAAVLHATGRDTYRCGCCFGTVAIEEAGER